MMKMYPFLIELKGEVLHKWMTFKSAPVLREGILQRGMFPYSGISKYPSRSNHVGGGVNYTDKKAVDLTKALTLKL